MVELEKLISGLEHCQDKDRGCEGCPYFEYDGCESRLHRDNVDRLRWTVKLMEAIVELGQEYNKLEKELKLVRAAEVASGTNYQKIKNMGPLHMVEWILKTVHPCECCDKQGVCGIPQDEVNDEYCAEHILLWLMQEVEK